MGLTSFGGPIAHLGYFRDELVVRRKWIDEAGYADLVALCQFLPGPASSQVGFALGILRGNGLLGGLAAWSAFTMPSAIVLFGFALGAAAFTGAAAESYPAGHRRLDASKIMSWASHNSHWPDRTEGNDREVGAIRAHSRCHGGRNRRRRAMSRTAAAGMSAAVVRPGGLRPLGAVLPLSL